MYVMLLCGLIASLRSPRDWSSTDKAREPWSRTRHLTYTNGRMEHAPNERKRKSNGPTYTTSPSE